MYDSGIDFSFECNPDDDSSAVYPVDGAIVSYDNNGQNDPDFQLDYFELTAADVGDNYSGAENNEVALESGQEGDYDSEDIPDIDTQTPSIATCYLINRSYQTELEIFRDYLDEKIMENRAMQEELMNCESYISDHIYPNSLLKFMTPYFRDGKNFTPDDNDDTKSRKRAGCVNLFYKRLKKPWKDQDKNNLRSAVESYVRKRQLEPLTRREDILLNETRKLRKFGDAQGVLDDKLEALEQTRCEIESIKEIPLNLILPSRDKSCDIDWLEISNRCSSIYTEFDCEIKWTNELHLEINHSNWTSEEETKLKKCVGNRPNWDLIAKNLGTNRTAWQCCQKYQSCFNEKLYRSGRFSYEEHNYLKRLVNDLSIGDYIPWNQVTYFMKERSLAQIKYYWDKINCIRRGAKWNELENKILLAAVEKLGTRSWKHVAYFIPGRSNRQCRERYMMRLGIKDRKLADWTFHEDLKLIQIAPNLKFRWVEMVAHILRRNARQIAARYDMIEKCLIANVLRSSKDLQDLVPRKKSSKKPPVLEFQLPEGQTIDDFLREGRKKLLNDLAISTYRPKVSRPGTGGRPKKAECEELIEQALVQTFSVHSLIGGIKQQTKRLDRGGQEAMIIDELTSILKTFFSKSLPQEDNLLAKVISLVLKKQTIGLDPTFIVYCPPIFPPNIVTTSSYQCLLFMRQHLTAQLEGKTTIDASDHAWHPHYRTLLGFLVSVYYWPCLLSSQPPISTQPSPNHSYLNTTTSPEPSSSSSSSCPKRKKGAKRKRHQSQQNIDYVNDTRKKQQHLFARYQEYLSNKRKINNLT